MAWDLSSVPDFLAQKPVLSSPAIPDGHFARSPVSFQAHSSNIDVGQPNKSAKRRRNGSYSNPSFRPTPNTASDNFPSAKGMSASLASDESMFGRFQIRSSSDLEESQTPPPGIASSPDGTSSIGKTVTDSHLTGGVSSTTSLSSAEQEKCYHHVDLANARKAIPAKPVQVTFSDSSVPSNKQLLELMEIFFTSYHPFLPCIHQKTFVERVKRRGSTESDPLLLAILAVAAL